MLYLTFGIVGDHHLHRVKNGTDTDSTTVQVITDGTFKKGHIVEGIQFGVTDFIDEVHDTLRTVASATEPTDSRHAGIIPAVDELLIDQCQQITLRHQGVVQVQFVELCLTGTVVLDIVCIAFPFLHPSNEQIIQGTVLHKLQGTPGVGDTFQIIALSVGKVVHGIGIPLVASTDMGDVQHTIDQRVAEQHVGMRHVDLCPQHECSGFAFATVHELEEFQVLLDRTVAERTVGTWTGGGAFLLGNHLGTLLVDIGTSLLDEPYGEVP